MHEFTVQTGNLQITIVAESARDAALEAVQVWEALSPAELSRGREAAHRANLEAVTIVRRGNGSARRGSERRFATFNLLAAAHGESPAAAWERVLRQCVGSVN